MKNINRRKFVKTAVAAGVATAMIPTTVFGSSKKLQIGVIGTGLRGQWMTKLFMDRNDVDVPVICDIDERMINMVLKAVSYTHLRAHET